MTVPDDDAVRGRHVAAVLVVLGILVLGLGLAVLPAFDDRPGPVAAQPVPSPGPDTTSTGIPTTEPLPAPPPAATAVPTRPDGVPACTPADLALTAGGFDAALGARAASVLALNTGPAPCVLEGTPAVELRQGGIPLDLVVEPGRDPSGNPGVAVPVVLAPGDTGFVFLGWRTYGGLADATTRQSLTVDLGAGPVDVSLDPADGPAPFDIAGGGTWEVAPWAPLVR